MLTNNDLKNLSLEEVIAKVTPIMNDYCSRHINHNFHDAEEMANSIMFTLSRKWAFLEKDKLLVWLYRVADKHISRHWKAVERDEKKKKKNKIELTYLEDLPPQDEPGKEDDYNKTTSNDDIEKYMEDIYNELPSKFEQDLYKYRYMEKKTLAEIVTITGIPYSTLYGNYVVLEKKVRILAREVIEKSTLY